MAEPASPLVDTQTTVSITARPGRKVSHQLWKITARDAPIMYPQLIAFGSASPRKASADSNRIDMETISAAMTMIGASALGRIWVRATRRCDWPDRSAACTNSRWRSAMNSARVRRATGGQLTTAMAMTTDVSEGE